jgi:hypothetical protein
MSRVIYRWLTLRVPVEFAARFDHVIERRASTNRPLVSRAQAIREALGEWMDRQPV